jgi:LysR family hydrogen peroxide-inducible transcriptional activator
MVAMQRTHPYLVPVRHDLDFHALEQFVVLARTRNFTHAAEELHLSQSALSRSIQRLEEQFGQPLFERRPRDVALTPMGELLLERSKQILRLVDDAFAEISQASGQGRLRFGAIPTIAPYFLPGVLESFAKRHPEIQVLVQEDTTDALIKRCTNGEIDLALVALPIQAKSLEVEPLFDEELLLVLPRDHPLATEDNITLEAVDRYPFVMLNEAHCLAENIAVFCHQQSVQPITIERTNQLATVQELVALNHGVSLIPEMARRIDLSDRRVYRSFAGDRPCRTVAMMWNPYRPILPAANTMMAHCRNVSGDERA